MAEISKDHGETVKDLIIHSWTSKTLQITNYWDKIGAASVYREIIPGGNKIIYILGHLLAIQDRMLEGMHLGDSLYPELDKIFLIPQMPDHVFPDPVVMRKQWGQINDLLLQKFKDITMEQWLSRHFYVSEQDFVKEPHRNVLNLLLTRTTHLANHYGQLILVKPLS
jgi:hypothetical protein